MAALLPATSVPVMIRVHSPEASPRSPPFLSDGGASLACSLATAATGPTMRRKSFKSFLASVHTLAGRLVNKQVKAREFKVTCPLGHMMSARITREVFACANVRPRRCSGCRVKVLPRNGCYRCHECNLAYCTRCAAAACAGHDADEAMPRSAWPADAEGALPGAGDLILTGPCMTISHVILLTGATRRDDEARQVLKVPDDQELYVCPTIETTPFYPTDCIIHHRLHRATYYLQRHPADGLVSVVGFRSQEGAPVAIAPLLCKFVFNPLRSEISGERIDLDIFGEAVGLSESTALSYGAITALKAVTSNHGCRLDAAKFPDAESQRALLLLLRKSWGHKPICSSVAISVWQHYFEMLHTGRGVGGGEEMAAKDILRWMPVMADTTTPSALVRVLTSHAWVLSNDLVFPVCGDSLPALAAERDSRSMGPGSRSPSDIATFAASGSSEDSAGLVADAPAAS